MWISRKKFEELEKRLWLLENPFKYNITDVVLKHYMVIERNVSIYRQPFIDDSFVKKYLLVDTKNPDFRFLYFEEDIK